MFAANACRFFLCFCCILVRLVCERAGIGTALYRSPEQSLPRSRYDRKADMYSLDIIFAEMIMAPFSTQVHEHVRSVSGVLLSFSLCVYVCM